MRDPVDENVGHRGDGAGPARDGRRGRAAAVALALLRRPRDTLAGAAGIAAVATIVINALFLQPGPHPAPIFALRTERPPVVVAGRDSTGTLAVLPRPRPADAPNAARSEPAASPKAPAARPRAELVTDIQRELLRRGYYDGAIDGLAGSKTEAAIREFEQAARLPPSGEPSEAILKAVSRAPVKAKAAAPAPRHDPIAGLIGRPAPIQAAPPSSLPVVQAKASAPPAPPAPATSPQVRSVQRALADYGYGQVRPTGVHDKATHDAIAAFEEARRMPITGQVSDRLVRELVALTGRPLE